MALELRLGQRLDLQLKLAPQIIQSIEILQLPSLDLQKLIDQELDTNEFLELRDDSNPDTEEETATKSESERDRSSEFDTLEAQEYWDSEVPRCKSALNHDASDRKFEAMNNTADRGPSLHEYLLDQWGLIEVIDEHVDDAGRILITHINAQGRLDVDFEKLAEEHPELEATDFDYAIDLVHTLEPKGIGARSTEECLQLQLDPREAHYEQKYRIVTEHLDDLVKNRRPKISKSLGISLEFLEELVQELAQLDYQPGQTAVDDDPQYIYPDIIVDWTQNGYEVRLAGSPFPPLQVSPMVSDVVEAKEVPQEYKEQVRKQAENAKWLISAIEQRQDTLLRVARRIIDYQRDFLDFGPHYLHPLKMQQIADDLGIHVSTVSRATNEKYMQTHRGIFSLKSFFSGATASVDGGVESRSSVKQRVKEIIDQEDKHKPLSDEDIVSRLRDNFGVTVARRTITKYRKALGIPSTRQRRSY